MVIVNRNTVRYNKFLLVVAVVVVFASYCYSFFVISLEHFRVIIDL